jgi:hypothetical protein
MEDFKLGMQGDTSRFCSPCLLLGGLPTLCVFSCTGAPISSALILLGSCTSIWSRTASTSQRVAIMQKVAAAQLVLAMILCAVGMYDCLKPGGYLLLRVHPTTSKAKWMKALRQAQFNIHGNPIYEALDPRRCTRPSTGDNSSCVSEWILARKGHSLHSVAQSRILSLGKFDRNRRRGTPKAINWLGPGETLYPDTCQVPGCHCDMPSLML